MPDLLDIQEKLQDTSAAIARAQRALAQNPSIPSVAANLRSLEKRWGDLEQNFRAVADRLELDVCHYRILFEDRPTLTGLASIWTDFQTLFSLVYDALKNGPKLIARLAPDVVSETSLGFAYSYPGSVGVVLTLNNERLLLGGTLLDDALRSTDKVIHASDSKGLAELSRKLGAPPIRAAYRWADDQLRLGMSSHIEWHRREELRSSFLVQRSELEHFRIIADETSPEETEEITVDGQLVGADVATHTFHIELQDGSPVRGKCAPEIISETHSVELPQNYRVTLLRTTKIRFSTEEPEVSWQLTQLTKR
jgi:hypothetical protein